ncbi:MAG: MATE family efflux transporter [Faecalibacillus sp.]
MNNELMNESIYKLMLKYSLPCICSLLVSSLYNIVDQIFIGQGIGYLANGATNVVFPVVTLVIAFSLFIGDGCAAYLSICQGQGDLKKANKTIGNGLFLIIILSIVLSLFCFLFIDQIIWMLGGTEQNFTYAKTYFQIIIIGFPFLMLTNTMTSIIRANGSPQYAMFSTIIGCIINIILDPLAIFVLDMSIAGAAIATLIGQVTTAIFSIAYLLKNLKIKKEDLLIDIKVLSKALPLGISSFLTQVFILVITTVLNVVLVKYGSLSQFGPDIPLTVMGIVMKVYNIVIAFVVGIAAGIQPIVGFNYGAGQYSRVAKIFQTMLICETIIGMIAMFVFELFPMQIISLFGSESALYNEFALYAFRVYFSTILLCCIQKSTSIFLQALGKPLFSMGLSLLRDFVISIPAVFIAAHFIGVYGPPFCAPVSDIISFIPVLIMMRYIFSSMKKSEGEKV